MHNLYYYQWTPYGITRLQMITSPLPIDKVDITPLGQARFQMPINRVQILEHTPVVAIDPIIEHSLRQRRPNKRPYHLRRRSKIDKLPDHGRKLQITPLEHDYPSLEFPEESAELPGFEAPDFEAPESHIAEFHAAEFGSSGLGMEPARSRLEFQQAEFHRHSELSCSSHQSELPTPKAGTPELQPPGLLPPKLHTDSSSPESQEQVFPSPVFRSPVFRIYAEFEDIPPLDPCLEFEYNCVDSDILISDA